MVRVETSGPDFTLVDIKRVSVFTSTGSKDCGTGETRGVEGMTTSAVGAGNETGTETEQMKTQLTGWTQWTETDQATKTVGTNQVAETDWTVETVQMEWKQRPVHTPGPRDQAVYSAGSGQARDK